MLFKWFESTKKTVKFSFIFSIEAHISDLKGQSEAL